MLTLIMFLNLKRIEDTYYVGTEGLKPVHRETKMVWSTIAYIAVGFLLHRTINIINFQDLLERGFILFSYLVEFNLMNSYSVFY